MIVVIFVDVDGSDDNDADADADDDGVEENDMMMVGFFFLLKVLESDNPRMQYMAQYFFGRGKTFRPMVVMLMSKLCNSQNNMGDR